MCESPEMQTISDSSLSWCICILMCVAVLASAAIFFRWLVSIPVQQAIYEKSHAHLNKHGPVRSRGLAVAIDDDWGDDETSGANQHRDDSLGAHAQTGSNDKRLSLCSSPTDQFVDAYEMSQGTWTSSVHRMPTQDHCRKKCSNDARCSGYSFDDSGAACHIVPTGASKSSNAGSTFLRGAAKAWVPCAHDKDRLFGGLV